MAAYLGLTLTVVRDGRDPWQVFDDQSYLGNSRVAPCTLHLKIKPCRQWLTAHAPPDASVLYVGLDADPTARRPDADRGTAIVRGWLPWTVRFPLLEEEHPQTKAQLLAESRARGIEPPAMYADGFPHANCGGACVRGGAAAWRRLLAVHPDRFAHAEEREQHLRSRLGDVAILRRTRGRVARPFTLAELRAEAEEAKAPPQFRPDPSGL
ncbi:hypothetical protein OG216_47545 (plasmid) [Streptomycetaceae bacterium NBC_01309]